MIKDGGYGWVVCGVVFFGFFLFFLSFFLALRFGLKHFQMLGGILIKGSLCLPSGAVVPAGDPRHPR